ncbi:unnamed protein product [Effrenium voratum]|nr:unnamed protein product [Effrenium voratum]
MRWLKLVHSSSRCFEIMVKRKAVATSPVFKQARKAKRAEEPKKVEDNDNDEEMPEEEVSPEEKATQLEEEKVASRKKELKALGVADIKEMASKACLQTGKKEDMIQAILEQEASEREAVKAREAQIRAVVVQKKEELEARSAPELKELCAVQGITGTLPKQTRVEKLLQQWQQDGGVDKALEQMVRDKQEAALVALDKAELLKQCKKRNLKPFVKEVMVDRLLKAELRAGHFAPKKVEEEKPVNGDLVEALLSSEAQRKKDAELKKQQDEADSSKRKELRVMSVEALKKALISKSLEASGRKDDMVEMLFQAWKQEQALASRKAELKALSKDDLKILAARNGSTASAKEAMIEAVLQQEAKQRQMQKDYDAKVILVLVKKREELDDKTNHELKEMCASRGLKAGSCKEDRVERLLENMRTTHEADKDVLELSMAERRQEFLAMDETQLEKLCTELSVDPLVKEVMVERLLAES